MADRSAPLLAHDRAGAGEPLVLVHPLGADRGVWRPVMHQLAAEHDVIAVDMPGFGESAVLPEDVEATAAALAGRIAATLDGLELERVHVAGISLGGWVALELAKSGRALTAIGIAPAGFWARPLGDRPEVSRAVARRVAPFLPALLRNPGARRRALAGVTAHPERVPYEDALRLVRAYADAPGFARANSAMRRALFEGIEDMPVPTTLAWCDRDRLVRPPRTAPAGVRSIVLRGCGHVPTWDDPEQVAAAILTSTADASTTSAGGVGHADRPRRSQ